MKKLIAIVIGTTFLLSSCGHVNKTLSNPVKNSASSDHEKDGDNTNSLSKKFNGQKGHGGGKDNRIENFEIGSTVLGISEDDLKSKITGDVTLFSMLTDASKLDEYKNSIKKDNETKINQLITENNMTSDQATSAIEKFNTSVDSWDGTNSFSDDFRKGPDFDNIVNTEIGSTILGISQDDLKSKITGDVTLYSMLTDASKLDEYKSAIKKDNETKINQLVTDGKITSDQATKITEQFNTYVDNWDGSTTHGNGQKGEDFGKMGGKGKRK